MTTNLPTLPATFDEANEAAARAFARDRIAAATENDIYNLGCSAADPEGGHRLVRRLLQHCALSNAGSMLWVVEIAAEYDEADIALRELIQEFHNRGEALPAYLAHYNDRILAGFVPSRPRGPKKAGHLLQDVILAFIVLELREKFGIRPTRSRDGNKRRASGCSIIAVLATDAGLRRGAETAFEKVWQHYAPIFDRADVAAIARI
jgi:hypothetical protein